MAKFLVHIGCYNDIEDIQELAEKRDANDVIEHMKNYKGAFHIVDNEENSYFSDFEPEEGYLTKDGKYFVTFPEKSEVAKGGENLFIDIYEVRGSDFDYIEGHCDEWCPECDTEVELSPSLGIYRCPSCGKWMVNCSMCPLQADGLCSSINCPLSCEAKRRNERERDRVEYPYE